MSRRSPGWPTARPASIRIRCWNGCASSPADVAEHDHRAPSPGLDLRRSVRGRHRPGPDRRGSPGDPGPGRRGRRFRGRFRSRSRAAHGLGPVPVPEVELPPIDERDPQDEFLLLDADADAAARAGPGPGRATRSWFRRRRAPARRRPPSTPSAALADEGKSVLVVAERRGTLNESRPAAGHRGPGIAGCCGSART